MRYFLLCLIFFSISLQADLQVEKNEICSNCSRIIDIVYREKDYPILPEGFNYYSFYEMTDEQRIYFDRGRFCMYLEMIKKYNRSSYNKQNQD